MGRNSREQVKEEIRDRCNIVDVIGQVVSLKRAGINWKGLCPFHNEKTPSFVVSEQKQYFTCFGCGASGDVFSFVQKYYSLEFPEAMEKLAQQCGVTIDSGYSGDGEDRQLYYDINREAAKFYYKAMNRGDNPAMSYMKKRGLSNEILRSFGIGYAGNKRDDLFKYLKCLGFQPEKMLTAGLISQSEGKYYDKFRNRVMFPIQNTSGKVIGFGGRVLGDGIPKYLNSQETPVFKKKYNLYGLNLTKTEISRENCGILVEGYMDVISLYQGGVRNVAASLGTALTPEQARVLNRYTSNIVLSYDSDNAGRVAALRGMDILQETGCRVKVLHVPEGKDPDDFIKKSGKSAYLKLIKEAMSYGDYKLHVMSHEFDLSIIEERIGFMKAAVEMLRKLSPVEADIYIKKLSDKYKISEGAIRAEYGQEESKKPSETRVMQKEERQEEISQREKYLIKILLNDSRFFDKHPDIDEQFESPGGYAIYAAMKRMKQKKIEIDQNKLIETLSWPNAKMLRDIENDILLDGNEDKIFEDCLRSLTVEELKKQEEELITKISMTDEKDNKKDIIELTEKLMEVQQKIRVGGRTF